MRFAGCFSLFERDGGFVKMQAENAAVGAK